MQQAPSVNWVIAHKLLPKLMTQPPQGMDPRLAPTRERADEIVAGMWRAAQAMVGPAPIPVPPTVARVTVDGRDAMAFCFLAMQPIDAHFTLAAPTGHGWRYLTVEKPMMGEGAVLGEWSDDRHTNHGPLPPPVDLDAFLASCARILGAEVTLVEGPRSVVLSGTVTPPSRDRALGNALAWGGLALAILLGGAVALLTR